MNDTLNKLNFNNAFVLTFPLQLNFNNAFVLTFPLQLNFNNAFVLTFPLQLLKLQLVYQQSFSLLGYLILTFW